MSVKVEVPVNMTVTNPRKAARHSDLAAIMSLRAITVEAVDRETAEVFVAQILARLAERVRRA